jgi:hypothetical protein
MSYRKAATFGILTLKLDRQPRNLTINRKIEQPATLPLVKVNNGHRKSAPGQEVSRALSSQPQPKRERERFYRNA